MIFSHAAYGINPAGIDGRAISGASINVIQYAAEDSSSVIKYIAALYNATTNVLLDSLSSGATNTVQFANVPITDVEKVGTSVPRGYSLEQNYPNPFNPSTIIRFGIANPDNVSLTVYDILGRSIATLDGKTLFKKDIPKGAADIAIAFNGCRHAILLYSLTAAQPAVIKRGIIRF